MKPGQVPESEKWWEALRRGNPELQLPPAHSVINATIETDAGGIVLSAECINNGELPEHITRYSIRHRITWGSPLVLSYEES